MLENKEIEEIREHLEKAQNPVFFFNNDPDGLCSFLLLQRDIERGKGVPIKSFQGLTKEYFRKISELKADYIFILDQPTVSEEFFKEVEQINLPVVWIDHHQIEKESIPSWVNLYNPSLLRKEIENKPTTFLCYQITHKKEDIWLALIGCISDKFIPDFYEEFNKKYPDFSIKSDSAFDVLYNSQIGNIARIFGFALKDKTTNVISMLKFLIKVKSPQEVLEENQKNILMHKRFNQINKWHQKFFRKAVDSYNKKDKILFFKYGGEMSISSDLSNELSHAFPDKIIIVAYVFGIKANVSVRGKKIREDILKSIEDFENARGGGHEDAVGIQMRAGDLEKFKENFEKRIEGK